MRYVWLEGQLENEKLESTIFSWKVPSEIGKFRWSWLQLSNFLFQLHASLKIIILNFRISELKDSWSGESWAATPAELFALPDDAVYNEPRDLRQNIYSDTWLETYDTVMDFGPYNEGLKISRRSPTQLSPTHNSVLVLNLYWQISGKFLRPFYWKTHPSKIMSFKNRVVS